MTARPSVRVLAFIEASWITGPAKNLLGFCRWAQAETELSISVATYCRNDPEGANNLFVQTARQAGIPTYVIPENGRFDRAVWPHIQALVKEVSPDIVQTHSVKSHFLIRSAGIPRRLPWLAFHHGYTSTTRTMLLYNQLDRWSLRGAARTVTVCRAFSPDLERCGVAPDRIRILHNSVTPPPPVSAEQVQALRQELGIASPDTKVILCIGRFSLEKGHADLLHALAQVNAANPAWPWQTVFVGSGPDRAALEALAAQLGLSGRVIFADFRPQVAPFYALADCFVLPSHSEGSSNVLLEAMAAKVPIAATRVGGNPEIVAHEETALLSPARDPAALAVSLQRILADRALAERLRQAAALRAASVFSPDVYRRTLLGIYREVLPGRISGS